MLFFGLFYLKGCPIIQLKVAFHVLLMVGTHAGRVRHGIADSENDTVVSRAHHVPGQAARAGPALSAIPQIKRVHMPRARNAVRRNHIAPGGKNHPDVIRDFIIIIILGKFRSKWVYFNRFEWNIWD